MFQTERNTTNAKHLKLERVKFSTLIDLELKKLSVIEIITPLTFDALGHPLPGSIYDRRLGPLNEKSGPCGTCRKNFYTCPGHFGYIQLPLPVVNPIYHKILGILIRIICRKCYRIQITKQIAHALRLQMELLDKGLLTDAVEVGLRFSELISQFGSYEQIPGKNLDELDALTKKTTNQSINNKNTESLRNRILSDTFRNFIKRKTCMYCRENLDKITTKFKKIIITYKNESNSISTRFLNPNESKECLRKVWENDGLLLKQLITILADQHAEHPTDVFYFDVIPVVPPVVRPINTVNGRISEHAQSHIYKTIINSTILLRTLIQLVNGKCDEDDLKIEMQESIKYANGTTSIEKLNYAWETLQNDVDSLFDRESSTGTYDGLKQLMEKKEGLIRMHMMGKRVNYSARSVITPDPNLNIDEIGIPEAFAKHLTYPVPVTPWNVEELRRMIENGPNKHPGALFVEFENGSIRRISPDDRIQQSSLLKRLLTVSDDLRAKNEPFRGLKIVHRHLINGDVLLCNRQPTLHRPSIMAHTARILKGEKTLRLHYANCKAYNADFDGDEMNVHYPQNEVARSEGYNLANVANHYLVPKDGTPLSGLIQDHMIAGVKLTIRGRFFKQHDYQHLVFQALSFTTKRITLLPPSIIKPQQLWSGKQVLSTVIINIIADYNVPINLTTTSKISVKAWQTCKTRKWNGGGTVFKNSNEMSETEVIIRNGELLVGVLDKAHYGATPYSLVHCVYELYGGACASRLLSALAKVFATFLQCEGFTLGVKDILTVPEADRKRKKVIERARRIGEETMRNALDMQEMAPPPTLDELVTNMENALQNDPKFRAIIDRNYKTSLDSFTNDINKACLPAGLICKFPQNNLQLMVQSGAKGSTVNTMQISCLLGQIELEGKRPPVMICGKSLPSFPIFEFAPRAGGFIDGRFMTGIKPQEFFFHCMAGREGLIDTAVKTSRSGYLQRCLIKHLEGLTVAYDQTVRDSDHTVIQFLYGEDGLDIARAQFLDKRHLPFLRENMQVLTDRHLIRQFRDDPKQRHLLEYKMKCDEWRDRDVEKIRQNTFTLFTKCVKERVGDKKILKRKKLMKMYRNADGDLKMALAEQCVRRPDPVVSIYRPATHYGALNERLERLLADFGCNDTKKGRKFKDVFALKAMTAACAPGEPVGLLAAQSIGEPSTQMTLNTFHFAGRGEMNVTLGIPRLREILMMASKHIRTPSMEIPFKRHVNEMEVENMRKTFTKCVVGDVLEKVDVKVCVETGRVRQYSYTVRFIFLPKKCYQDRYDVEPKMILKHMAKKFFGEMFGQIRKLIKISSTLVQTKEQKKSGKNNDEDEDQSGNDDRNDHSTTDDEGEDEDAEDGKLAQKKRIENEAGDEEDENDVSDMDNQSDSEDDDDDEDDDTQTSTSDKKVVDAYKFAQNYLYDNKKYRWCQLTFGLPVNYKKLDLTAIIREVAARSVLHEIPHIKRAITYMRDDVMMLRTEGINILEMFKYHDKLILNRLYSNDIHAIAMTYGIEAAARVIVREVRDVFGVYGIRVDARHLSLIADYMTTNGTFEALNRTGIENSASPFQQMSFESSMNFLKNALIRGKTDDLSNPSSCLMVGKPCQIGTGCFGLFQKIPNFIGGK